MQTLISNKKLWLQLLRSVNRLENELNSRMRRETGISLAKFDALAALYFAKSGMTMSEITKELLVTNGNTTGLITRLVKDGFVEKWALPTDRRIYNISITPKGKKIFKAALTMHDVWIDELMSGIDEEDRNYFYRFSMTVDKNINKQEEKTGSK